MIGNEDDLFTSIRDAIAKFEGLTMGGLKERSPYTWGRITRLARCIVDEIREGLNA